MNNTLSSRSLAWQLLPGGLVIAAVLMLFYSTAAEMVDIWSRSVTYNHAFLVPPIAMWLIWRQRARLAQLPIRAQPWMLLPLAMACCLWLLGDLAGVNAAAQFALVSMILLTVPTLLGFAVTRALTFPLLFLYFAVPFGSFLVPTMMDHTADFTVMALRWTGVPVYREGLQFIIPSGNWSVVEACSGIRYLIASFMVGTLFAYLNYQSPWRRAVFMLVSLVVPVVANWFRAYMIVMLGHLTNNELAVGVDHLLYGWVFFGVIIGLMFMIGARWAEPDPVFAPPPAVAVATRPEGAGRTWLTALGVTLVLLATHAAVWTLDQPQQRAIGQLELPRQMGQEWQAQEQSLTDWRPFYRGALLSDGQSYAAGPSRAGAWVGYYRDQGRDNKLISSANAIVEPEHPTWSQVSTARQSIQVDGRTVGWRSAELRGSAHPGALSSQRLLVWQTFWIGGALTESPARAKLQLAYNRVLGRGDDAAVLMFYMPLDGGISPMQAQEVLQRFVSQALPPVLTNLNALLAEPAAPARAAP